MKHRRHYGKPLPAKRDVKATLDFYAQINEAAKQEGVKMTVDKLRAMIQMLPSEPNHFLVHCVGGNKYNCLGDGKYRVDENINAMFLFNQDGSLNTILDVDAIESVTVKRA